MGLSIALPVPMYVEAVNITFFACLFFLNGQAKTAVKLTAFFLVLAALSYIPQGTGIFSTVILPVSFMARRFMLPIVAGKYLIDSTPVGLLMSALEKLKMPANIVITLSVMFRFFPTMKTELAAVGRSMRNRRLAEPERVLGHPVASCEYVLIPLLLRCLQVADQLAASAVARGANAPGVRGSYGGRPSTTRDWLCACLWTVGTACFLVFGGVRL